MYNKLRFKNGLLKALTLSYDDGAYDDMRLIDIMNKYGLKGTFNLNSSMFFTDDPNALEDLERRKKKYLESGNEIACHGVYHYNLPELSYTEAFNEVYNDRKELEKQFGVMVRGMAYAFSGHNAQAREILKKCGICYSRVVGANPYFELPEKWLELCPTCHHDDERLFELAEKFTSAENTPAAEPMLFYLWGHSHEFPRHNNWDRIEKFGEMVGKRDDIWYATNIEIYDYIEAYRHLEFSADGHTVRNGSCIDVWFSAEKKKTVMVPAGKTITF